MFGEQHVVVEADCRALALFETHRLLLLMLFWIPLGRGLGRP